MKRLFLQADMVALDMRGVSVRLISADGRMNLRIALLSRGTTIGEMALVEQLRRSATRVADEHVVCYKLLHDGYARLLSEHPVIAAKLLTSLFRELARRNKVRMTK